MFEMNVRLFEIVVEWSVFVVVDVKIVVVGSVLMVFMKVIEVVGSVVLVLQSKSVVEVVVICVKNLVKCVEDIVLVVVFEDVDIMRKGIVQFSSVINSMFEMFVVMLKVVKVVMDEMNRKVYWIVWY